MSVGAAVLGVRGSARNTPAVVTSPLLLNRMIKLQSNPKGLLRGEFLDHAGQECSIQEASEAEEDCLWLGVDKDIHGEDVLAHMKLTRETASRLIPLLRGFVAQGDLREDTGKAYAVGTWVRGTVRPTEGIEGRVVYTDAHELVIQDNLVSGTEGRYVCTWDAVSVLWEPVDKPDHLMSRFDRIRIGDL